MGRYAAYLEDLSIAAGCLIMRYGVNCVMILEGCLVNNSKSEGFSYMTEKFVVRSREKIMNVEP